MDDGSTKPGGILRLIRALFAREDLLSEADAASTLFRFFRSKHVADLRLIVWLVLFMWVVDLYIVWSAGPDPEHLNKVDHLLTYFGPAIAFGGLVIGWAYQTAAARLGVVDLFACEISTLCRVGTAFDVGKQYVQMYVNPPPQNHDENHKPSADSTRFVSSEHYFPVFDNNSRDLQVLEALVVSRITEFYTYMKATRDLLRKLAEIRPPQGDTSNPERRHVRSDMDLWHGTMADVIYIVFLGFESGRKAIQDLLEFQPTRAERTIVILLTELECYHFLLKQFDEDKLRHPRLLMREKYYIKDVPKLYNMVNEPHKNERDWEPAKLISDELAIVYNNIFPHTKISVARRRDPRGLPASG